MAVGTALHDYLHVEIPFGTPNRPIFLDGRGGNDLLSLDYRVPDDRSGDVYHGATLIGGSGNDYFVSDNVAAVVHGDSGDDYIRWTDAPGEFHGGFGNDFFRITGTGHAISIEGGTGNDGAYVDLAGGSAIVDLGAGNDYISLVIDTATVLGGSGDDRIEIRDQTGTVTVDGGVGADFIRIEGTAGRSILSGGAGNDRIYTWASEGSIDAGSGLDDVGVVTGRHVVTLGGAPDTLTFITGYAEVTDFRTGNSGDRLILRDVFDVYRPGTSTPQSLVADGYIRFVQDGADTLVQGDQDAGGTLFGWTDLVRLDDVRLQALNAHNLDGLVI